MNIDIKDLINKSEYFSKNNIDLLTYESIDENTYILKANDNDYELCISDINLNKNLIENSQQLKLINANPLEIYEYGYYEDSNLYYQIREYRKTQRLSDYLLSHDKKNNYCLGIKFGEILYNLHKLDNTKNLDWYQIFTTKANYLFYMHGMLETIADDDYILIDYINDYRHLTKNNETNYIFNTFSPDEIFVSNDKEIFPTNLHFKVFGDPSFDFTSINTAAIYSVDFARGVYDKYFTGKKAPLRFLRLVSLYQAYEILYNKVALRSSKKAQLSVDSIEKLLKMYDNFNQDYPDWLMEG